MRLVIAFAVALTVAISLVGAASVFAAGEAVVVIAGGQTEPAREWDIDVDGGTASTSHVSLAPAPVGFQGEFTVAVAGSSAAVTLTTALAADRELASVGCLDDATPSTEINPAFDGLSFTLDVVGGRTYRCFATSGPAVLQDPVGEVAPAAQPASDRPLPRSDASMTPPAPLPGWPAVLMALVVIVGVAYFLRPLRR